MTKAPCELMRTAREKAEKTQADIALELDLTQPLIARWESGASFPRTEDLRRVAKAYGLKPEQLVPQEIKDEAS